MTRAKIYLILISGGFMALFLLWQGQIHPYTGLLFWTFLLQGILAFSYNFLGGYGGELHLGHGTFFGIGAYVSALLILGGFPWWLAVILSGLGGAAVALLLSPILIPLRGGAFSLASLVCLLLFYAVFRNLSWLTGGVDGLSLTQTRGLNAWLTGTILLFMLCFYIHDILSDSKFTRDLRAIADDPQAAALCGLPGHRIRTRALLLGSAMAGSAGGILPVQSLYISLQSTFGLEVALAPVVIVLIGGPGTRFGPLWGTILYVGLQELIWTRIGGWHLALLGLVLILTGVFFPSGLAGIFKSKATPRLFSRR